MDLRFTLLLACFFLSGLAALLYQTAWTRELSFVFGTSELAVAVVLAAYMGGLALGSMLASRLAPRLRRPVLAYGVLELAIALSALSVPVVIRAISAAYFALLGGRADLVGANTTALTLFQLGSAFVVLLPPTAFMGATLPLLARHAVRSEREIGQRVGVLYAVNTAGAIVGTLAVAFWLMPAIGLRHTVEVGACLNGLVFVFAAFLSRAAKASEGERSAAVQAGGPAAQARAPSALPEPSRLPGRAWILPIMLVSGAVSFSYEVVWTRLLGHLLGASLDAFATMLASFLLGISLGSAIASRWARDASRAAAGFALAQLGIAIAAYVALVIANRLPALADRVGAGPGDPLASSVVAIVTLLPVTICIGATFPFAVRVLAASPEDAASATARVYAWNTVGAIVGALGTGFYLLPGLGFDGTITAGVRTSAVLAAATALLAGGHRVAWVVAAAAIFGVTVAVPVAPPWELLCSSPLQRAPSRGEVRFAAVGRSATVLLFDDGDRFLLTTNGLPEAKPRRRGVLSSSPVVHWLGMLPSMLRTDTKNLLVVGLGGAAVLEPIPSTVAHIDVIELEPEVVEANLRIADVRAIDPLRDPRLRIQIGDARGLLQLTDRRYDAIVSQPSHPWTAGASHLYTREFFALVDAHLGDRGVFVQWIGLQYIDEPLLRTLAATLTGVFDYVEIYQPRSAPGLLFAASRSPLAEPEVIRQAIGAAPADFERFGIHDAEDVFAARVLDAEGTRALAEGGVPNTDDHNLLAARASRLGTSALKTKDTAVLWHHLDPSQRGSDGLDRSALIRTLVQANFVDRAMDLALTATGAQQEVELGWLEFARGHLPRARRHFERATSIDPDLEEARLGHVALGLAAPPASSDAGFGPPVEALIEARELAAQDDWAGIMALDAPLSSFGAGDALYIEATRMRVRARLEAGDAQSAEEAQRLAELLLARSFDPEDTFMRARAAIACGHAEDAWGSLTGLASIAAGGPALKSAVAPRVFELSQQLPPDLRADIERRLAPTAPGGSRSGPPGGLRDEARGEPAGAPGGAADEEFD